jgi:hypothetical protein
MRVVIPTLVVLMTACSEPGFEPCTKAWYAQLETRLGTGDGQGHGPDIGGEEWMSVIEFKLGVRGRAEVPPLGTPEWCLYIDEQVF